VLSLVNKTLSFVPLQIVSNDALVIFGKAFTFTVVFAVAEQPKASLTVRP